MADEREAYIHNLKDAAPPPKSIIKSIRKESESNGRMIRRGSNESGSIAGQSDDGHSSSRASDRSQRWKSPLFKSKRMRSRSKSADENMEQKPTRQKRRVTISKAPAEVIGGSPASTPTRRGQQHYGRPRMLSRYTDMSPDQTHSTRSLSFGDHFFDEQMVSAAMRWETEPQPDDYSDEEHYGHGMSEEQIGVESAPPNDRNKISANVEKAQNRMFRCFPDFKNRMSWSRTSSVVVRHAPCFWCCASPLETSATDRAVLTRLNVLCAVFAVVQAAVGLFLVIIFLVYPSTSTSQNVLNIWNMIGLLYCLGIMGLIIFITMMLTMRVIREVNLLGAVRYMWALYWLLPIDIFLVIGLFDYHRVTNVWVKHWWHTPTMDWFRTLFCEEGTAHTKCMVPVNGGENFTSAEEWCLSFYNSTDCEEIRIDAQAETNTWCYLFLILNVIWGTLLIFLLLMTMNVLQGIITPPIVQQSKETNVPAWLTLPIAGCFVVGLVFLLESPYTVTPTDGSITGVEWIGTAYVVAAGTFTIAALLGWFISAFSVTNIQAKRRKKIAVALFILTMIFTILAIGAIFATSLIYSFNVVSVALKDDQRGSIACDFDTADSCTNCCGADCGTQCPEWTEEDVVKVVRTQMKQSATLAAIFLIYAASALRFGLVLRSIIAKYQIDYV